MKRIILIRHGQTEWNIKKKLQGHKDTALNDPGKLEAERAAKKLAEESINEIYSSDLKRAYSTAKIISRYHIDIEIKRHPELREINFGQWEGLTYQEIEKHNAKLLRSWFENPHSVNPPDGESLKDLKIRVVNFIEGICKNSKANNILLVTHGGVIRTFLLYILKMNMRYYWKIEVEHCNLTILKYYDGDFILNALNKIYFN